MAGEWHEKTLDDLGRIITGKTPSSRHPEYFGDELPFVTPTDMDERRLIESTRRYLTEEGAASVGNSYIPASSVMVSCIGSDMGKAALAGRDCVTNQQINSIVVDSENDPHFVYYNLSLRKAEIRGAASGSAQPILNKTAFGKLHISLPPAREQRAIARILGTLDDKIELNRRMNETLEEMARAIFKSWFVDFDPVRAKAEGRDPVLPEHIADLFPDRFEDSELGEIPAGWSVGTLAYFAELNPESWSKGTAPNEITYVDLATTKWGKIEETQRYFWEDAPSRARRVLRSGDTIVGTVRPGNGSFCLIAEENLTGSTGFAVLRPRRSIYEELVYLGATSTENIERLSHLADGAAYPAVRPDVVSNTVSVQPSEPVIENFSRLVVPLMSKIATNQREIRTLAATRDALLPKLISGELRVGEVERILEGRI